MTDTDFPPTGPPAGSTAGPAAGPAAGVAPASVLAAADAAVAGLAGTLWAARSPEELLDTVRATERLRSRLDAVQLQVVAEVDATNAARTEGWASTKDFVTAVTGGLKGTGRRLVALARAVASDRVGTGTALAAATISRSQAEVIVAAVDQLPVNPALRAAAEGLMVTEARVLDATDLTRLGRGVVARLDPDGDERRDERALARQERAAHAARFLSITEDGIGGVRLKGRGTVEDAAWLKTVLYPLAAPAPSSEPGTCGGDPDRTAGSVGSCGITDCAHDGRDPREHGARLWDALIHSTRLLAGTNLLPESHGARPRISLALDYETLLRDLTAHDQPTHDQPRDEPRDEPRRDDASHARGSCDTPRYRDRPEPDTPDPNRPDGDRRELQSHASAVLDAGALNPDNLGSSAYNPSALDPSALNPSALNLSAFDPGALTGDWTLPNMLETGGLLSAQTIRRLACDADIIPIILGTRSQILDVGRSSRLVTPALWTALVARDQHCTFPGCQRLPIACDAHHLVHWLHHGVTALHNLTLLCPAHHTLIHTTPWEIRLNQDDQRPEFLPPPHPNHPEQPLTPIRRRPLRT